MYAATDQVLEDLEQGTLTRRQAVGRLVALAAATFAGGGTSASTSEDAPTFRSVGLNHIALRVTDIPRSRDFYQRHLGLTPLQESAHNCFMGAGANNFVALFRSEKAGLDHYCFTIDDYDADQVMSTLRKHELSPRRAADRVYFDDPDGIEVQLASEWGDYPRKR